MGLFSGELHHYHDKDIRTQITNVIIQHHFPHVPP